MNQFVLTAFLTFAPVLANAHDHATAHYLGNEGVMVEREDTKILFDAFYANGFDNYPLVPHSISNAMLRGEAPFDGVDAIFVSHVHGDHFTAKPAITYLRAQPDVVLFGPTQVRDAILKSGVAENDPVMRRVKTYTINPEDSVSSYTLGDLEIDVVAVPHTGTWTKIQNYAWRVTLGDDTTVIHLGDADPRVSNFARHQAHFDSKKTHTAFPPYWFIGDRNGELILNDIIKATQSIGIHVPKAAIGNGDQWRKKARGDLFTDPGETRTISSPPKLDVTE